MKKFNQTLTTLALAILTLVAIGCGKSGSDTATTATPDLYQDQYDSSCQTTGRRHFGDRQAFCEALRDDSVNNNCASEARYESFKSRCPGYSWNHHHRR